MPLVDVRNLDFAYRDQLVLKHVDLAVEAGSTLGVIGVNGGGKTTLVKLLLGLEEPTRGTITVAGLSPRRAVGRGDLVGYLPQNPSPPAGFPISVRQVARLGLVGKTGLLRAYRKDDLQFVDHLLDRVGIADLANLSIGQLSGGQQQRAYIARALAARPKLLVLDEPTTGIDRRGQQQFIDSLQQLKAELGLTVVFVSHDLRAVTAISDRIACLNVTLHYHDTPQRLPADLVYRMFACDLEAIGVGTVCNHPGHVHSADTDGAAVPMTVGGRAVVPGPATSANGGAE
ncbi:MAG TPA: metal ABC transporter ATP-binding protein [Tepidisphaeraceae bacterium]|nr:metal ABC transporter ATP-binding protein [Tepidisphaeraceae bacterium]